MDALFERSFLPYAALALITLLLPGARARALAGSGLLLAALGSAADRVGDGEAAAGFATTNALLIGVGAAIVVFAAIRAGRKTSTAPEALAAVPRRSIPDFLLVGGLLFAALGPHLILVAAGVFLALVSGAGRALGSRRSGWIALIVVAGLLLGAGFFLLFTILGPVGGAMSQLAAGPFSPPAERLLAVLLGIGPLVLAGGFPFHLAPWRGSLSPVAAILLARVLVPALPEGLHDWQAPAMLWLTVAMAVDSFSGRWTSALVGGGLLGIWSGRTEGVVAGAILVLFGWLADARLIPLAAGNDSRWSRLWLLVPAAGLPLLIQAALSAQVLISVVAVLAAATALAWESRRRAGAP